MRGVETKWRRLEDVAKGMETVLRGLEVILQIWRLGGHFCRTHDVSTPPPSYSCTDRECTNSTLPSIVVLESI